LSSPALRVASVLRAAASAASAALAALMAANFDPASSEVMAVGLAGVPAADALLDASLETT